MKAALAGAFVGFTVTAAWMAALAVRALRTGNTR